MAPSAFAYETCDLEPGQTLTAWRSAHTPPKRAGIRAPHPVRRLRRRGRRPTTTKGTP